ncbi:sigma-70 family RNA polymerase sigma factor [Spirosoma sp. SC4-14]|uniref:RNA polymerase sigma factor n=1 Tax=Spirosoma sp. SC4-14 TaxID=3128900 RepID=UPI0030D513DE
MQSANTNIPHHQTSHLEHLQASEQQNYIKEAINRHPPRERLMITLYYLDEKSIWEIEEITGLSESNIKIKLFRARKVLEEQLRFLL